ncbi:MAG: hypothetical protein EB067_05235 [Actinobacteria bacterium]|nr:hypothetical protein [Actinomycetota bacterium]
MLYLGAVASYALAFVATTPWIPPLSFFTQDDGLSVRALLNVQVLFVANAFSPIYGAQRS